MRENSQLSSKNSQCGFHNAVSFNKMYQYCYKMLKFLHINYSGVPFHI